MTNKEAGEQLENLRAHCSDMLRHTFTDGEDIWGKDLEALDLAIKALEQEPKWIPVSERLPDTDDDVLVTDGVDMFVAWYKWQEWRSSDNNFEINTPVDAWMPLPEPYKTESEDKVGYWYKANSYDICYTCSICGVTNASGTKYNYCPHCGAKMTESEEKE